MDEFASLALNASDLSLKLFDAVEMKVKSRNSGQGAQVDLSRRGGIRICCRTTVQAPLVIIQVVAGLFFHLSKGNACRMK